MNIVAKALFAGADNLQNTDAKGAANLYAYGLKHLLKVAAWDLDDAQAFVNSLLTYTRIQSELSEPLDSEIEAQFNENLTTVLSKITDKDKAEGKLLLASLKTHIQEKLTTCINLARATGLQSNNIPHFVKVLKTYLGICQQHKQILNPEIQNFIDQNFNLIISNTNNAVELSDLYSILFTFGSNNQLKMSTCLNAMQQEQLPTEIRAAASKTWFQSLSLCTDEDKSTQLNALCKLPVPLLTQIIDAYMVYLNKLIASNTVLDTTLLDSYYQILQASIPEKTKNKVFEHLCSKLLLRYETKSRSGLLKKILMSDCKFSSSQVHTLFKLLEGIIEPTDPYRFHLNQFAPCFTPDGFNMADALIVLRNENNKLFEVMMDKLPDTDSVGKFIYSFVKVLRLINQRLKNGGDSFFTPSTQNQLFLETFSNILNKLYVPAATGETYIYVSAIFLFFHKLAAIIPDEPKILAIPQAAAQSPALLSPQLAAFPRATASSAASLVAKPAITQGPSPFFPLIVTGAESHQQTYHLISAQAMKNKPFTMPRNNALPASTATTSQLTPLHIKLTSPPQQIVGKSIQGQDTNSASSATSSSRVAAPPLSALVTATSAAEQMICIWEAKKIASRIEEHEELYQIAINWFKAGSLDIIQALSDIKFKLVPQIDLLKKEKKRKDYLYRKKLDSHIFEPIRSEKKLRYIPPNYKADFIQALCQNRFIPGPVNQMDACFNACNILIEKVLADLTRSLTFSVSSDSLTALNILTGAETLPQEEETTAESSIGQKRTLEACVGTDTNSSSLSSSEAKRRRHDSSGSEERNRTLHTDFQLLHKRCFSWLDEAKGRFDIYRALVDLHLFFFPRIKTAEELRSVKTTLRIIYSKIKPNILYPQEYGANFLKIFATISDNTSDFFATCEDLRTTIIRDMVKKLAVEMASQPNPILSSHVHSLQLLSGITRAHKVSTASVPAFHSTSSSAAQAANDDDEEEDRGNGEEMEATDDEVQEYSDYEMEDNSGLNHLADAAKHLLVRTTARSYINPSNTLAEPAKLAGLFKQGKGKRALLLEGAAYTTDAKLVFPPNKANNTSRPSA